MDEVEALVRELCAAHPALRAARRAADLPRGFQRHTGFDPLAATTRRSCRRVVAHLGYRDAGASAMSCWTSSWAP